MNEKREQLVLEKSEQFEQKKCLQVDSKLFDKMITSEGLWKKNKNTKNYQKEYQYQT